MTTEPAAQIRGHLWTTDELAAFLQKSRRTLATHRRKGVGPPFLRLGGVVRYNPADVLEWLQAQRSPV